MSVEVSELFRVDGKVAVVTGSGQGIGRGIAIGLAQAGADVVINARREADVAETVRGVEACGRRALAMVGDIRGDTSEKLSLIHI